MRGPQADRGDDLAADERDVEAGDLVCEFRRAVETSAGISGELLGEPDGPFLHELAALVLQQDDDAAFEGQDEIGRAHV